MAKPKLKRTNAIELETELLKLKYVEAIVKAGGIMSEVARILKVSRRRVYDFVGAHPDLLQAVKDARDENLDVAEAQLMIKVKSGDLEAIKFLLRTLGQKRGYVEKTDINNFSQTIIRINNAAKEQTITTVKPLDIKVLSGD